MLNQVNSYSNNLTNLYSNKNNAQTTNSLNSSSQNTTKVLGYEVDKDGFFTEEFNKVAGIPSDYKIYAKGGENFVNYISAHPDTHTNIDFAKSLGNVYKLFSQIMPNTENSSFSKEQIASLPVAFEYDTKSFELLKTYTYEQMQNLWDYLPENSQFAQIFPSRADANAYLQGKPSEDIFQSNPYIDIGANAYKNADGSIDKGGVLMAFFSARLGYEGAGAFFVGETTIRGKLAGLDSSISETQIKDLENFLKDNRIEYGTVMDLVAGFKLKASSLSIDEFKAEWLKLKAKSDELYKQMQAGSKSVNFENLAQNNDEKQEQNTNKKTFTPIQATSKNDIYKDIGYFKFKDLLKNQQDLDTLSMLFESIKNNNKNNIFSTNNAFDFIKTAKLFQKLDIKA